MTNHMLFIAAVATTLTTACARKATIETSRVQGTLAASSFPSAPRAVEATDERGKRVRSAVAPDGSFRLELLRGHTYALAVLLTSGADPVVFPRAGSKRLDTTFRIKTGGALVSLGAVRHLTAAPSGGFVMSAKTTLAVTLTTRTSGAMAAGEGAAGECVDGNVKGTGAPCADDDAKASCDEGVEGENETELESESEAGGDAPEATDADPTKSMAVAEHNAPDQVDGCNDGFDGEQEGEHED